MSFFSDVDERILHECLKFMEGLLDKSAGKKAMETFFADDSDNGNYITFNFPLLLYKYLLFIDVMHFLILDMVNILLSAANSNLSPIYGTRVLKFFSKLFQQSK